VLDEIEQWIDRTLADFAAHRVSCEVLLPHFSGFYSPGFLRGSYFVVVDVIPKPDFPELRQAGLGDFIDMDVHGITYKNTYFIKKGFEQSLRLHFHELVHVLQWNYLGPSKFIERYIEELNQFGYDDAPLEAMAYSLDADFSEEKEAFDIEKYVEQKI